MFHIQMDLREQRPSYEILRPNGAGSCPPMPEDWGSGSDNSFDLCPVSRSLMSQAPLLLIHAGADLIPGS